MRLAVLLPLGGRGPGGIRVQAWSAFFCQAWSAFVGVAWSALLLALWCCILVDRPGAPTYLQAWSASLYQGLECLFVSRSCKASNKDA